LIQIWNIAFFFLSASIGLRINNFLVNLKANTKPEMGDLRGNSSFEFGRSLSIG
jgi:hypothetical protein